MKVYLDDLLLGEVPDRRRKPGELFSRLAGVSVSNAVSHAGNSGNIYHIELEPLYVPLIRWQKRAGQILIEFNGYSRPYVYVTLQRRPPYVQIQYIPWWLNNQKETE